MDSNINSNIIKNFKSNESNDRSNNISPKRNFKNTSSKTGGFFKESKKEAMKYILNTNTMGVPSSASSPNFF